MNTQVLNRESFEKLAWGGFGGSFRSSAQYAAAYRQMVLETADILSRIGSVNTKRSGRRGIDFTLDERPSGDCSIVVVSLSLSKFNPDDIASCLVAIQHQMHRAFQVVVDGEMGIGRPICFILRRDEPIFIWGKELTDVELFTG